MVSNSTIKLVQSLKHKKYRQKYNLFVVEGWKSIATILSQDEVIVDKIYTSDRIDLGNFRQAPDIVDASTSEIRKISLLQSPADAIALIRLDNSKTYESLGPRVIYLDNIQDPGNLGTIVRIADW